MFFSCASSSFKSQTATIQLKGNPSTGYSWEYTIGDKSLISVDEAVLSDKSLDDGKVGLVGAPESFIYTIRSLKAGKTSLTFEYKRSWENLPAAEVHIYEVSINNSGKIDLKEISADGKSGDSSGEESSITNTYKSVSMSEGLKMMEKDSAFILLDVRRPDEYKAGHIPGAIQLTNESMTAEKALALLPDKNQNIYVYCRSGRRSKLASQKLIDYGYKNIIEIGGILDYSGSIEK